MTARRLFCERTGCRRVLGWADGGQLTPLADVRFWCEGQLRCRLVCPACGARTEWRGDRLVVPRRKPPDAA